MTTTLDTRDLGYLSLQDAARFVGIHAESLRRLLKRGYGPAYRLQHGTYLFPLEPLRQWTAQYASHKGHKEYPRGLV